MQDYRIPLKPPSVNTYWRNFNGRMLLSKEGRQFKKDMQSFLQTQRRGEPLKSDLKVTIALHFKDNRRRDVDNFSKAILDSMTGIIYDDDSQIQELTVKKTIGCDENLIIIYVNEVDYDF